MIRVRRGVRGPFVAVALLVFLAIVATACGTDEGDAGEAAEVVPEGGIQKVTATDRLFGLDDLKAAGFKKSKTYNVEGLQAATEAYYGFFGLDPYNRQEYEIRVYASHDDAVQYGMPLADNAVGEDAKLKEDEAVWDADLRERRECKGDAGGGPVAHHIGMCLASKYADYVVYGNMVVLCQGDDQKMSREHCAAFLGQMQ